MENEMKVTLNADEKAVAIKTLKDRFLHDGQLVRRKHREVNFQCVSSFSIDIFKVKCPCCNQIIHEMLDHEVEQCLYCESSINTEAHIEELLEGAYTLLLDPRTGIPEIIEMNERKPASRSGTQRELLKAEWIVNQLVDMLKFYSEPGNYLEQIIGWGPEIPVIKDGGQRAQKALQMFKEGSET